MKRLSIIFLMLFLMFAVLSCAAEPEPETAARGEYKRISAEEAKEMIDNEDVIVVDVRTEEEFEETRIEGALLIPDYEIQELAAEKLPDKDATILIYCRTGRRSENASRALLEMGYTNVYDFGGIVDWDYETFSEE